MPLLVENVFWPTMLDIASCLCAEIEKSELPNTCFCGIIPGESVPLDYCDPCEGGECGMAWVRLVSVQPLFDIGLGDSAGGNPCNTQMVASVEVGIARCAPGPDLRGRPPTMADQLAATELQFADMAAARRAAVCCKLESDLRRNVSTWLPFGPSGGCMGGIWTITLAQ